MEMEDDDTICSDDSMEVCMVTTSLNAQRSNDVSSSLITDTSHCSNDLQEQVDEDDSPDYVRMSKQELVDFAIRCSLLTASHFLDDKQLDAIVERTRSQFDLNFTNYFIVKPIRSQNTIRLHKDQLKNPSHVCITEGMTISVESSDPSHDVFIVGQLKLIDSTWTISHDFQPCPASRFKVPSPNLRRNATRSTNMLLLCTKGDGNQKSSIAPLFFKYISRSKKQKIFAELSAVDMVRVYNIHGEMDVYLSGRPDPIRSNPLKML